MTGATEPSGLPSGLVAYRRTPIAVAPEQPHEVAPDGPVRFFVEFYRAANPDDSAPSGS